MNRFDDELKAALSREDAPEGFAEKVLARVNSAETANAPETARVIPFRPRRALFVKWAAAIAALLLITLFSGLWWSISHKKRSGEDTTARATRPENVRPAAQPSPEQSRTEQVQNAPPIVNPADRATASNQYQNKVRSQASNARRARHVEGEQLTARNRAQIVEPRRVNQVETNPDSLTPEDFVANDARTPQTDTARHIERVQVLLRSFRNTQLTGIGAHADLAYDRQSARKLLYKNILLRREAAARGQLPAEEVLGRLEPLLIDIANLPERPALADVNLIRGRMQKSMTIAVLQVYAAQNSPVE
ncbi:MAG TPA: hypothetical protein VK619_06360 [Pyrinomonadaceae bacterium]|nr:hypothetical protein [Pyrinomonadaceae bacterium]